MLPLYAQYDMTCLSVPYMICLFHAGQAWKKEISLWVLMTKQQLNLLGWLHLRLTVTYNIYIYTQLTHLHLNKFETDRYTLDPALLPAPQAEHLHLAWSLRFTVSWGTGITHVSKEHICIIHIYKYMCVYIYMCVCMYIYYTYDVCIYTCVRLEALKTASLKQKHRPLPWPQQPSPEPLKSTSNMLASCHWGHCIPLAQSSPAVCKHWASMGRGFVVTLSLA